MGHFRPICKVLAGRITLPPRAPDSERELRMLTCGSEMTHSGSPGMRAKGHTGPICLLTFHSLSPSLWGPCSVGQGEVLGNSARSEPQRSLSDVGQGTWSLIAHLPGLGDVLHSGVEGT